MLDNITFQLKIAKHDAYDDSGNDEATDGDDKVVAKGSWVQSSLSLVTTLTAHTAEKIAYES